MDFEKVSNTPAFNKRHKNVKNCIDSYIKM